MVVFPEFPYYLKSLLAPGKSLVLSEPMKSLQSGTATFFWSHNFIEQNLPRIRIKIKHSSIPLHKKKAPTNDTAVGTFTHKTYTHKLKQPSH